MIIQVRLHGILRDRLPAADKGRTTLDLPSGATITAVLNELDIHRRFQVAINEEIEDNLETELRDGDRIEIFRPSAGGAPGCIVRSSGFSRSNR